MPAAHLTFESGRTLECPETSEVDDEMPGRDSRVVFVVMLCHPGLMKEKRLRWWCVSLTRELRVPVELGQQFQDDI